MYVIVILAMIAGFLALRLYSVLGHILADQRDLRAGVGTIAVAAGLDDVAVVGHVEVPVLSLFPDRDQLPDGLPARLAGPLVQGNGAREPQPVLRHLNMQANMPMLCESFA